MGNVCLVKDQFFPLASFNSEEEGVNYAISALARKRVSPETLNLEPGIQRFRTLTQCSRDQLESYDQRVRLLTEKLSTLDPQEIATRLENLYARAFRYNPKNHQMNIAQDPLGSQAKRELDLWMGAIYHRAYQEEAFLTRIKIPRIEKILLLASEKISPQERGTLYRLEKGLLSFSKWWEATNLSYYQRLKFYSGQKPLRKYSEYFEVVLRCILGENEVRQLKREHFPPLQIHSPQTQEIYEQISLLSNEELVEKMIKLWQTQKSVPRKRWFKEMVCVDWWIVNRGIDADSLAREINSRDFVSKVDFSSKEAKFFEPLWIAVPRLDQYQQRFEYLNQFREKYEKFLRALEARQFEGMNFLEEIEWSQWILNRSLTGLPISSEDLDRIRIEVKRAVNVQTLPVTWQEMEDARELGIPKVLVPEDIPSQLPSSYDLFEIAAKIYIGKFSLLDIILEYADYIVILPEDSYPPGFKDTHGFTGSVYKTVFLRAEAMTTPGLFIRALFHEVAHHFWYEWTFHNHPKRLPFKLLSEQFSYLLGASALSKYMSNGFSDPLEEPENQNVLFADALLLKKMNVLLQLPENDTQLRFWDRRWNNKTPEFFNFPYAELVKEIKKEIAIFQQIHSGVKRLSRDVLEELSFSEEESEIFEEALEQMNRLPRDEKPPLYLEEHPLKRFINKILVRLGKPEQKSVSFRRSQFEQFLWIASLRMLRRENVADVNIADQHFRD
jgi:hypothetical protein